MRITNDAGVDRVLQCAGSLDASRLAFAIAGKGSTVAIEGLAGDTSEVGFSPDLAVTRRLSVTGVNGWSPPDFQAALRINESGVVQLLPLLTHRFRLEEFRTAFDLARRGAEGIIKATFSPQSTNVPAL